MKTEGAKELRNAAIGAVLLWWAACGTPGAAPRMVNRIAGTEHSLAALQRGQTLYVSVTDVCEGLLFAWEWDFTSQKLTCVKKGRRIVFVQGMPFYLVNDTLRQIPVGPVRDREMLYLPPATLAEVFSGGARDSIAWDAQDSSMMVNLRPAVPAAPFAAEKIQQPQREIVKTVVIDPGHGGMDPGAIGPDGLEEKQVVLGIALAVRDLIKKKTNLNVYLTRETDKFIPLVDRTRFANDKKADIFLSIHANSIEGNRKKKENTRGYKVYFLSQAKNEEDKLAAMRENAVIELEDKSHKYDNLQDILNEMAGNEFLRESQDLSIMVTETFTSALKKIPRLHLGVGQANFWVLNGAYMPSVLLEVGFISNEREEKELADPAVQKSIATGIYEAVAGFKKKYEEGQ
jgi:N-acetylmuramoyl-L-alanine amidase